MKNELRSFMAHQIVFSLAFGPCRSPLTHRSQSHLQMYNRFLKTLPRSANGQITDGRYLGATLDRNGLRPSCFCITLIVDM
ncbi:uncharacterized protein LOC131221625 isoform X2 [Magnolia sinica]|uniref:uncharacterized protein LOC131221625 isoform X2 n=1 Tax=Magnolia sinica TaxID=86752 RepID=UPI0026595FBB|nr:uncharacterized protein LOC131221625 isoform X2 [Magnolia sinica]